MDLREGPPYAAKSATTETPSDILFPDHIHMSKTIDRLKPLIELINEISQLSKHISAADVLVKKDMKCKSKLTLLRADTYSFSMLADPTPSSLSKPAPRPLYTPQERARRDATIWTTVQGILAPFQFAVFLVSLGLVLRTLATGEDYELATGSILLKTAVLYAIMVTGAIWEKVVFGQYLFAPAFFWEDVVSFGVIALHTLYVIALFGGWTTPEVLLGIALAAYAAYVVNAAQFLWKLRTARLEAAA